jgi:hypothetical protein
VEETVLLGVRVTTPRRGKDPKFPNRPDHPDFWKLSDILIGNDTTAESGPHGLDQVMDSVPVDMATIIYMANQRVMRSDQEIGPASPKEMKRILWVDAFIAGYKMAEARAQSVVKITVDPTVDGSHRQKDY